LRLTLAVHAEDVHEPGLDQHEWQTQWEALEPELADAPAEALPELARLVDEMLEERGYEEGADPEIDGELELGREVVVRLEAGEVDVDAGDVGAAVRAYRSVFSALINERRAP
jgi:hypothetical protein